MNPAQPPTNVPRPNQNTENLSLLCLPGRRDPGSFPPLSLYELAADVVHAGGPVIAGMSLRNRQFTDRRQLSRAIEALAALPSPVSVMVTDGPFVHNLAAIGYPEEKIERESRDLGRALRKAVTRLFGDTPCTFVDWEQVYSHPAYRTELAALEKLREHSASFRADLEAASYWPTDGLAKHYFPSQPGRPLDLRAAGRYVLEEFAFLIAAPAIYEVPAIAYAYHHRWEIAERLLSGHYDNRPRAGVGLLLMDYSGQPHTTTWVTPTQSALGSSIHTTNEPLLPHDSPPPAREPRNQATVGSNEEVS